MSMYIDPRTKNKYFNWFGIYDFECHPDEITEKLKIVPSETRIKGERRSIGQAKHTLINKGNAWILNSDLSHSTPIEDHVDQLLSKIIPYRERFLEFTNKYYSEFGCAVYFYEANPGIQLDEKQLSKIASLNTIVDFDIYCLSGTVSQFESPNAEKELIHQFSKHEFLSRYSSNTHSESVNLAKSLIEIDSANRELGNNLEDAVIWDELEEAEFKKKFERVGEDLKKLINNIKNSAFLSSMVKEEMNIES